MIAAGSSDCPDDPEDVAYKPVIYLYPEEELEVSVKLDIDGEMLCTYPAYKDGWVVTASPDGTLTDAFGRNYAYLFWEATADVDWKLDKGFCVRGEDTEKFLEDALDRLGLTSREAGEFIAFWLPRMQNNEYNLIAFQSELYNDYAALEITPAPDTLIRVFMAYSACDEYVELEPQELTAPERIGFVAVEWGGSEISRD